ncbi:hypothetical protein ACVDG5_019890 [Mesorhizobium sp. ORM6]
MTDKQISSGQISSGSSVQRRAAHFAGQWIAGADLGSRSVRRRLMAVLRMAHRVLGMRRKGHGLGMLSNGGMLAAAFAVVGIMIPQTAFAQVAIGNGVVTNLANCTTPSAGGKA